MTKSLFFYLLTMLTGTIAAMTGAWLIIANIAPTQTGWISLSFLYVCIFLAVTGWLAILGFLVRLAPKGEPNLPKIAAVACRQAGLVGIFAVTVLLLSAHRLLNWWSGALLIIILAALEFLLLTWSDFTSSETDNH